MTEHNNNHITDSLN